MDALELARVTYHDAFIAELGNSDGTAATKEDPTITSPRNFATDTKGSPIRINKTGATGLTAFRAKGTTYDGATRLLRASTPVKPGNRKALPVDLGSGRSHLRLRRRPGQPAHKPGSEVPDRGACRTVVSERIAATHGQRALLRRNGAARVALRRRGPADEDAAGDRLVRRPAPARDPLLAVGGSVAGARRIPAFDERDPGPYPRLARYDRLLAETRAHVLRILLTVFSPVPRQATRIRADHLTEPSPVRFERFVTAVGRRYRDVVDMWAIGNEPNHPGFLLP